MDLQMLVLLLYSITDTHRSDLSKSTWNDCRTLIITCQREITSRIKFPTKNKMVQVEKLVLIAWNIWKVRFNFSDLQPFIHSSIPRHFKQKNSTGSSISQRLFYYFIIKKSLYNKNCKKGFVGRNHLHWFGEKDERGVKCNLRFEWNPKHVQQVDCEYFFTTINTIN